MPRRASVTLLPGPVKEWLDKALVDSGFADYRLLEETLRAKGYEISRSSLHRYGKSFEDRLSALKLATEQARAIVSANPDEEGAMGEALMRLIQEKLFGVLLDLQVDPAKLNLGGLARSVAELCKASVTQKKWAVEVQEKARKEALEQAATAVEKAAKQQGLTAEQAAFWREQVLGVR